MKRAAANPLCSFESTLTIVASLLLACLCAAQTDRGQQLPATDGPENSQPKTMSRREVTGIIAAYRKIVSLNGVEELFPFQIKR